MTRRAGFWTVINILVVIYALLPVLWILSLSLKPTSTVKDGKLIPSSITFDNYKGIFKGDVFTSALINSIGIGLITTVIAVVIGGMAAYAVARLDFRGKRALTRSSRSVSRGFIESITLSWSPVGVNRMSIGISINVGPRCGELATAKAS